MTPLAPLQLEVYLVSLLACFALGWFVLPPLTQAGAALTGRIVRAVRARRTRHGGAL